VRDLLIHALIVAAACSLGAGQEAVRLAEPWRTQYTGADATGDHVVALWGFDPGAELVDLSGKGHDLTLNGAQVVDGGKFGGCLESARGYPDADVPHQAWAAPSPDFPPKGAFTVEMWIKPKPDLAGYPDSFLLDNRYVDKTGMQLILGPETGAGRVLRMYLGFGDDAPAWSSRPFKYQANEWYHIAFTYDGNGSGRFYINGTAQGGEDRPERGAVLPGVKRLVIGDRVGSLFHGFPGYIDQVRICRGVLEFAPASFEVTSLRRAFQRMEPDAKLTFVVTNKQREPMSGARVLFTLGGIPQPLQLIPDLPPGGQHTIDLMLDTSLRPDTYRLAATIEVLGTNPTRSTEQFEVTIAPRPVPDFMPVVMWGGESGKLDVLHELGFTHFLGVSVDFKKIWNAGQPTEATSPEGVAASIRTLDQALARGMFVCAGLSPGRWARGLEQYRRVQRDGTVYSKDADVCGLFPEIRQFCYNVGASVAQTYGNHPALQTAMVHSEVRGETRVCFHEHDRAAFRAFAGFDIPDQATSHVGVSWDKIPDFPANRVIPDNYPLLVFYRWFWKEGDGWNSLHTAVHEGFKSTGRGDLWTFHDPAVRCLSVYGSGGDVDYLSHWTYTYPDPIRIGLCTDELLCMAGGAARGDQKVMKMTQIIWYRSQTAPEPGEQAQVATADFTDQDVRPAGTGSVDASGRYTAAWEREIPDARFITIAPMHLREALWTKLARPIQGIMYHGIGSLLPLEDAHGAYRYTNPETKWELQRLVREVIQPLGPTLKHIPDRPADVAFLESFASQIFARRGTWGWNGGWEGDAYLILHYAGLQPRVIYDETIEREGLDAFKVVVAVNCDVLTQTVADALKAFQNRGGIIIGDENLCPAIQPDILLPSHTRPKEADAARALNLEKAAALRAELDAHYQRYAESSTPDVITRVRSYNSTDYLFAVNDAREFGDYVGHHKLVMENGLPTDAVLTIRHPGGHVYDLVTHRAVPTGAGDGLITIPRSFGPCEGCVLMVTDRPISAVRVEAPQAARPGESLTATVTVLGDDDRPLDAIVPVRVEFVDPAGRLAEFSGWYAAQDGRVQVSTQLARNDTPGLWRIHAQELASGLTADAYVRVAAGG